MGNIIQCVDDMLVMLVSVLIVIFPTSLTACHNHCLVFEVLLILFFYYTVWFYLCSPIRTRTSHYELESLNSLFRERFPRVSCVYLVPYLSLYAYVALLVYVGERTNGRKIASMCVVWCVCIQMCVYVSSSTQSVVLVF